MLLHKSINLSDFGHQSPRHDIFYLFCFFSSLYVSESHFWNATIMQQKTNWKWLKDQPFPKQKKLLRSVVLKQSTPKHLLSCWIWLWLCLAEGKGLNITAEVQLCSGNKYVPADNMDIKGNKKCADNELVHFSVITIGKKNCAHLPTLGFSPSSRQGKNVD